MARRTPVKLTPLRRHFAAVLTIALSCTFVAVMVLAGNLMQSSLRSQAAQQFDGADLQIERPLSDEDWSSEDPLDPPEVPGADAVWPQLMDYIQLDSPDGDGVFLTTAMLPPGTPASAICRRAEPRRPTPRSCSTPLPRISSE